jgi:hypothetical protein
MIEHPPPISELPLWRKVLFLCALGFFVFVWAAGIYLHLTICGGAPDHAVPSTGQVYAVHVIHGYLRYVTLQQLQRFNLWAGIAVTWAGAAFVGAFFLWVTYRTRNAKS